MSRSFRLNPERQANAWQLPFQQTKSWVVPNLELPGYVCYGSKSGFATWLVAEQFCTIKRSLKLKRCTMCSTLK